MTEFCRNRWGYDKGKVTWLSGCSDGWLQGEQKEDGIVGELGRKESEDGKLWHVEASRQE